MSKYEVKIVPNSEPNADGRWVPIPDEVSLAGHSSRDWNDLFGPYIEPGYHVVQIRKVSNDGHQI